MMRMWGWGIDVVGVGLALLVIYCLVGWLRSLQKGG